MLVIVAVDIVFLIIVTVDQFRLKLVSVMVERQVTFITDCDPSYTVYIDVCT